MKRTKNSPSIAARMYYEQPLPLTHPNQRLELNKTQNAVLLYQGEVVGKLFNIKIHPRIVDGVE